MLTFTWVVTIFGTHGKSDISIGGLTFEQATERLDKCRADGDSSRVEVQIEVAESEIDDLSATI